MNKFLLNTSKYNEIKSAIQNSQFPLIIYGPTGTGKTFTINKILKELKKKHIFVDISLSEINKPLIEIIRVIEIQQISEMNKINNFENLIIETNIEYLEKIILESKFDDSKIDDKKFYEKKFDGSKIEDSIFNDNKIDDDREDNIFKNNFTPKFIKFNKITKNKMQRIGFGNFDGNLFSIKHGISRISETVNIFHLIGKLFYKKVKINEFEIKDEVIYQGNVINDSIDDRINDNIDYNSIVDDNSIIDDRINDSIDDNTCINDYNNRNFISDDDLTGDAFDQINLIDQKIVDFAENSSNDYFFLNSFSDSELNSFTQSNSFSELNSFTESNLEKINQYDSKTIIDYIYTNMLKFITIDDIPFLYDSLSNSEFSDEFKTVLLKAVLELKGCRKGFISFKRYDE